MLTAELLAFFDACVATALWSDCIAEGEKRTKIASHIQTLVDEHKTKTALKNREALFEALH